MNIAAAATAQETWERVEQQQPDLVLLDLGFPDCRDLSLLSRIKQAYPDIAIIILTSQTDDLSQVVAAIKLGAFDYVGKPFDPNELKNRVANALNQRQLKRTEQYLLNELEQQAGLHRFVGTSRAITSVIDMLRKLAAVDGPVLVRGESGTGKELAARALHYLSGRRKKPFVTVNCGSIPEALVESALFGHRKGAFTGALESAQGKFALAEDGTLFLDEIGEMPMMQQVALLRVLEYRKFTPVGEGTERECHARFLFATNRDLKQRVTDGKFREDLYYRINVASIIMPSLRSRAEDIPPLVNHYVAQLCADLGRQTIQVHPDAMAVLQRQEWPGNVRELRNVLEGALMLMNPNQVELGLVDLPSELIEDKSIPGDALTHIEKTERDAIVNILEKCNWSPTEAAKLLGMHRNSVTRKIHYYKISKGKNGS
jgi:DNA-binding NtrC family response regulator